VHHHHEFASLERPTTANLLNRDIASDADVSEAMRRVEEAQARMQQLRAQSAALGNTAKKYSGDGDGDGASSGAEVLVIRHDEDDDSSSGEESSSSS
jgi:hypothetical protein